MKKNPSDKQEYHLSKLKKNGVKLTPSTPKLEYIANIISVELFSGDVVLLDNGNYQIPDSSTTRGIYF